MLCTDCCFDYKWTVGRPGWRRSQSCGWQWDFSLCSRWVWKLVLRIPSTSPLQRLLLDFYPSSAGLSAVFAVRNSCPQHLNSLESAWASVSVGEILLFECLSEPMQVYVQTWWDLLIASLCMHEWMINSAPVLYMCKVQFSCCDEYTLLFIHTYLTLFLLHACISTQADNLLPSARSSAIITAH